jgi:hypothetical protein
MRQIDCRVEFLVSSRQIFISSSNQERLTKAVEALELLPESEVLVLAPTRGAADDFARALCHKLGAFLECYGPSENEIGVGLGGY